MSKVANALIAYANAVKKTNEAIIAEQDAFEALSRLRGTENCGDGAREITGRWFNAHYHLVHAKRHQEVMGEALGEVNAEMRRELEASS